MSFSPHVERIRAAGAEPARWALVLHGVFGFGGNWRLFTRKLAARCPGWGFALVDLRGHGRSLGAPPPHDVAHAAADLLAIDGEVRGVIGHSLGGKVALAYAARRAGELDRVWVVDSQPGVANGPAGSPTFAVLHTLESLPEAFETRDAFVREVERRGHERGVAAWLAMSLERGPDGYRLRLELPTIRAILEDYYRRDLWPELERDDPRREVDVVVAGRSFVWGPGDRQRLEQIAATRERVHLHVLPDAGHWVHVDAGDTLLDLMAASFG